MSCKHNKEYIFNSDRIKTVADFHSALTDFPRWECSSLWTVRTREGEINYYELSNGNTYEKWLLRNLDDCLAVACSDAYMLGMLVDARYVVEDTDENV